MSSYIVIDIDTSNPNIEIYAPSYTTTDIVNEITIQADEELSLDYQEIYVIDANGVRYDYTFLFEEDSYVGNIKFNNFAIGSIVTIYARVMDIVGNKSNLISKSIHIADSITLLTLEISDRVADVTDNSVVADITISNNSMNIEISDSDRSEKIG